MQPRGLRNCNPGNIRLSKTIYLGEVVPSQDRAFKQFQSMAYGYRAMFVTLHSYYTKHQLRTIRQMISRWAPPGENNTAAYIRTVSLHALCGPDEPVDIMRREQMVLIVSAMSKVENGVPANIEDVIAGWDLYIKK